MILGPGLVPLIQAFGFVVLDWSYWFLGFVLASLHDGGAWWFVWLACWVGAAVLAWYWFVLPDGIES